MEGTIGIEHTFSEKIQDAWSEYDKVVAKIHLQRYGKIVLDNYELPIDNEFALEEIEGTLNTK